MLVLQLHVIGAIGVSKELMCILIVGYLGGRKALLHKKGL